MAGTLQWPRDGEVLICLVRRSDVPAAGRGSLSTDEKARADAITHSRSAARFRAGRLLLRDVAGRLAGVPPGDVIVTGGEGGPPRLGGSLGPMFASVSHGEETEAVAFASAPVGIDVEDGCPPDFRALAPVVMHPGELDAFTRLDDSEARTAFLRLWTRKEAVLKAAGMGFSLDPRSFSVGIGAAMPVDLDAVTYALADLPGGKGAVALAGPRAAVRFFDPFGRASPRDSACHQPS